MASTGNLDIADTTRNTVSNQQEHEEPVQTVDTSNSVAQPPESSQSQLSPLSQAEPQPPSTSQPQQHPEVCANCGGIKAAKVPGGAAPADNQLSSRAAQQFSSNTPYRIVKPNPKPVQLAYRYPALARLRASQSADFGGFRQPIIPFRPVVLSSTLTMLQVANKFAENSLNSFSTTGGVYKFAQDVASAIITGEHHADDDDDKGGDSVDDDTIYNSSSTKKTVVRA